MPETNTARFLVYGGTRFDERARIGVWPAIPLGALGDFYGLRPGADAYGVGILENRPFLIFRRQLIADSRGGYPLTLLLDPGEAVWVNCRWHAAALLNKLLRSPALEQLVQTPEKCTAADVVAPFLNLPEEAPITSIFGSSLGRHLAYSLFRERTLILTPAQLGLERRPRPEWVTTTLAAVFPAFRIGAGWLIGGGSAHASAFGVKLILDDQGDPASKPADSSSSMAIFQSLDALNHHPNSLNLLSPYFEKPMWLWPHSIQKVEQGLRLLADLSSDAGPEDGFEKTREYSPDLPFADFIHATAVNQAARSQGKLKGHKALLILEEALAKRFEIEPQLVERLGADFFLQELPKRGYPPAPLPSSIKLGPDLLVRLWKQCLRETMGPPQALLIQALEQLPTVQQDKLEELVQITMQRNIDDFGPWSKLANNPRIGKIVRNRLREELGRRLKESPRDFDARAYLLYGDDPELRKLEADLNAFQNAADAKRIVVECVNAWLEMLESDDREKAEECLQNLAYSPLRSWVPISLKTKIIDSSDEQNAAWQRFEVLVRLFDGEKYHCSSAASGEELRDLDLELQELFETPSVDHVPLLARLKSCLGTFSDSLLHQIRKFRPSDPVHREQWCKELKEAGLIQESEWASLELMLDFPDKRMRDLDRLSETSLKQVVNEVFFGTRRLPNIQIHVTNFEKLAAKSAKIKTIVHDFLEASGAGNENLARYWLEQPAIPESLLNLFPDANEQIISILDAPPELLFRKFGMKIKDACMDGTALQGVALAVAKYVAAKDERVHRWGQKLMGYGKESFPTKLNATIRRSSNR